VDPNDYNRVLGHERWWFDDHGVLPVRFVERYGPEEGKWLYGNPDSVPANSYLGRFRDEQVYRKVILHEFARVTRAMRVQEWPVQSSREPASIDLRYSDGNPAVVSRSVGAGRVVLCTTSAGMHWTYWPQAAGLFVPLVQLSLAHLRRDG